MKAKNKFYICFFVSFLVYGLGISPLEQLPPLLKILNPMNGLWAGLLSAEPENTDFEELIADVKIQFDKDGIPHIFAENEDDLYFAQGYLHAYHRLFQMDLQRRLGSGRLSELVGKRALEKDYYNIKMGLREGARRTHEAMMSDKETKIITEAYIKGVNKYIESLSRKNLPPEYKILNAWPQKFETIDIAYFFKTMTAMLAGRSYDLELSRLRAQYGADKLGPWINPYNRFYDSILSKSQTSKLSKNKKAKNFDNSFESVFSNYPEYLSKVAFSGSVEGFKGSNNWAVGKEKSSTGHIIVSNDTHLKLSLPAIWYENQLITKNFNVYGASFPGAPGVIIGTNNHISWAVTNATLDVMDWYEVEFKNSEHKEYKFEGQWKKVKEVTEVIKIRGLGEEKIKQLWTHLGPVTAISKNKGLVVQWITHKKSNDWKVFNDLNKARNYNDCKNIVFRFYGPAQNFICADREDYGIFHSGLMAKKRKGQGDYILDGSVATNDWLEFIPRAELPRSENPSDGFVRSANQIPTTKNYPYYLGWYYDDSYRAYEIRKKLMVKERLSAEDFVKLQGDSFDEFARQLLPILTKHFSTEKELNLRQKEALKAISQWNHEASAKSFETSLFYVWWWELRNSIWSDQLWNAGKKFLPRRSYTVKLLKENKPESQEWLNDIRTEDQENIKSLIETSFFSAWRKLESSYGTDYKKWYWYRVNQSKIDHVGLIPGFGAGEVETGGSRNTIKANKGSYGPSWKMVVEMSRPVRIWSQIPGGVTGHPFLKNYTKFVEDWSQSKMRAANYLEAPNAELSTTTFEAER